MSRARRGPAIVLLTTTRCSAFAPEGAAGGPVFLPELGKNDVDRFRIALQDAAGFARNGLCELAFLFLGTAGEHFDSDQGHINLRTCSTDARPGGGAAATRGGRLS